ncbi:MAG TPA: TetR/AcrR family transcriptional regulator [Solirubrobacteraceae bacterium]|nr:TetR/AcrR family transcriptional regulator [Solirubrobacteraceae bacterium]
MSTNTKERIVDAGATLFRRQGYAATGVKQIVTEAEAPFSSLYHFFPDGKDELATEIIRSSGHMFQQLVEFVFDSSPDVLSGVENCFAGAAETLRQTGYADACPIATVALEVASTNEPLREATAEVFESWIKAATDRFLAAGIPEKTARELAIGLIGALEGAFLLSRAARSTEPMDIAGATSVAAVRAALAQLS